jgi:hypothetical protein
MTGARIKRNGTTFNGFKVIPERVNDLEQETLPGA